jgi:long-subunit fatty acid transport protein
MFQKSKNSVLFWIFFAIEIQFVFIDATAQTNTENFAQLEFNFNNPGARANGIGGAFISLADDATATEANPAGLTTLIKPEFSFEIKAISYKRDVFNFSSRGSAIDFDLIGKEFKNGVISPSFASIVFPLKNLTLSAFRHELVNFESTFFTHGSLVPTFTNGQAFFPVNSATEIKVVNWGGAAGLRISNQFSVGVSAGISQADINSSLQRFRLEIFDEQTLDNEAIIDDSDSDVFVNVGLIFKPTEKISFGGVFKKRPKFQLQNTIEQNRLTIDGVAGIVELNKEINFKVPTSLGAGISFQPSDALTFAFDVVRVNYSDLTDNFVVTALDSTIISVDPLIRGEAVLLPQEFNSDAGFEIHAGAEYVGFLNKVGYVLRGGVFTEPDNSIEFVGPTTDDARALTAQLFRPGDSDFHVTFGLGLLLTDNFQIDLAGNLSKGSDEFVGSFVYRLGK